METTVISYNAIQDAQGTILKAVIRKNCNKNLYPRSFAVWYPLNIWKVIHMNEKYKKINRKYVDKYTRLFIRLALKKWYVQIVKKLLRDYCIVEMKLENEDRKSRKWVNGKNLIHLKEWGTQNHISTEANNSKVDFNTLKVNTLIKRQRLIP